MASAVVTAVCSERQLLPKAHRPLYNTTLCRKQNGSVGLRLPTLPPRMEKERRMVIGEVSC